VANKTDLYIFYIPEGAFVSVSNGVDETYIFDGKNYDDATINEDFGEDG
jgi:hypothetical protein